MKCVVMLLIVSVLAIVGCGTQKVNEEDLVAKSIGEINADCILVEEKEGEAEGEDTEEVALTVGSFGVVLSCGVRARKALFYKVFAGSYFLSGSVKNRHFLKKWCSKWCSKREVTRGTWIQFVFWIE